MIKDIANIFKQALEPLKAEGLISNLEGLVRVFEFKPVNSEKKIKIAYPVDCQEPEECVDCQSTYVCVPEKEKKCLVYFEGTQARTTMSIEDITTYESIISLICWYNLDKYEKPFFLQSIFISTFSKMIKEIRLDSSSENPIELYHPTIASIYDSDASIFSKYSYSDSDSGFLGCKYSAFKIDFKVKFNIYENTNCFNNNLVSADGEPCLYF